MSDCITSAHTGPLRPAGRRVPHRSVAQAERGGGIAAAPQPQDCTDDIVDFIPSLRAYGRSLCKSPVEADDLVQETLVRAIEKVHQYQEGTNLRAWLFTIMRNRFYSDWIKRSRERPGDKDCASAIPLAVEDTQFWHLRQREMESALRDLPIHYRETIMLVAVLGESYLRAAEVLGCDIGTVKSRINRARSALRAKLGSDWEA